MRPLGPMPRAVVRHVSTLTAFRTPAPLPARLSPPSDYSRWLADLVRRFGPGAVRRWRREPENWTFECWKARRRSEQNLFGLNARRGFPEDGNVRFNGCFQSHRSG